jgi:hypothetical protein
VAACTLMERPPTTSAARMSVNCASMVTMLCTCACARQTRTPWSLRAFPNPPHASRGGSHLTWQQPALCLSWQAWTISAHADSAQGEKP